MKIEEATKWMEEAIQDAKEFFDQCSPALQKELTEQEEVFKLAITALCSVSRVQELEAENKELKERMEHKQDYISRSALLEGEEQPMIWHDSTEEVATLNEWRRWVEKIKNAPSISALVDLHDHECSGLVEE